MNKKVYLFAAVAALFAACSNNDGAESAEKAQAQAQAQQVPLAFDTYVSRSVTRSGTAGEFTGTNIKTTFKDEAFGVFAYYTNSETYDQVFTPNFMYNQLVKWNGSAFTYEPIKYWPNEYGSNALSDDVDKVSFFAYAPYVVATNPASGKVADTTKGITGFTHNNVVGDPMVKYITTFGTDEQVDLCWGVVAATPPSWDNKNTGTTTSLTAGMPWLNIEHPTKTSTDWDAAQKVTFDFNHALAALNVQVDTKTNSTSAANPDGNTKVYIRSVTFEGFATKGALNLNNTTANTALWYNYDTNNELDNGDETVIQDGRKDGKEGITAATREYARINPNFVQSTLWDATSPMPGVTGAPENLFSKADGTAAANASDYIYVIPNGDKLKVTIEYDVLTADGKLSGYLNDGKNHGSVVKNTITRYITASGTGDVNAANGDVILANGKKYLINLHLGLNSVEFDASVTAWGDAGTPDGGANLPQNN